MAEEIIKLKIKLLSSDIFVEVNKNATVPEVKAKIKEQIHAEPEEQKLIYQGLSLIIFI